MDIALFLRVLGRHKIIVAAGCVLAIALAFLSFARVSSTGVSYRQNEQWVSYSTMLVSQAGFQWGSLSGAQSDPRTANGQPLGRSTQAADPNRLTALAIIYAHLADSDAIRRIMEADGPVTGKIEAAPLPAVTGSTEVLPILSIAAMADTQQGAIELARRDSSALGRYIVRQQQANGIRSADRVQLSQIAKPVEAKLFAGRSKTLPVVVFLAVLLATFAVTFVQENISVRTRALAADNNTTSAPAAEAAT